MARIFVTGATGMLGSHLVSQLLEQGDEVHAIRRKNSSVALLQRVLKHHFKNPEPYFEKIQWHFGDLLDRTLVSEIINNCTQIYHTAAIVSFNPEDHQRMINTNVEITKNCVDACLQNPSTRLIHVSSIASLGRVKAQDGVVTEETHWQGGEGCSAYSISKYNSEEIVWKGIEKGLKAAIVNPSIILGYGEWSKGSSELFNTMWKGLKFYTTGRNGYVDVSDVALVMRLLMNSNISGQRYILNAANVTYKTLFDLMAKAFNKPSPPIKVNAFVAGIAWRVMHIQGKLIGKRPLITKETARTSLRVYAYSSQKIEKELDFKFKPIEETISKICSYFIEDLEI